MAPDSTPTAEGASVSAPPFAIVAIGRNEGERLRVCLTSARQSAARCVVYVDSGSTDRSVEVAIGLGCAVVNLDMGIPFTAARARNEGFRAALAAVPGLRYVQFVDGDCELEPAWLGQALAFLEGHPKAAVACGRRRERYPERSVYNQLCDQEWNTPIGRALACGGDAMMRVDAFQAVGGYRDDVIAGEEPELCVRLRAAGWEIWRLDLAMTIHDAAILAFGQWWKRARRGGFAYAQGNALHGGPPEGHWRRETHRAVLWGLALPLAFLLLLAWKPVVALGVPAIYLLQWARLSWSRGVWPQASFMMMAKFAEAFGVVEFWSNALRGKQARIIEYK